VASVKAIVAAVTAAASDFECAAAAAAAAVEETIAALHCDAGSEWEQEGIALHSFAKRLAAGQCCLVTAKETAAAAAALSC